MPGDNNKGELVKLRADVLQTRASLSFILDPAKEPSPTNEDLQEEALIALAYAQLVARYIAAI